MRVHMRGVEIGVPEDLDDWVRREVLGGWSMDFLTLSLKPHIYVRRKYFADHGLLDDAEREWAFVLCL